VYVRPERLLKLQNTNSAAANYIYRKYAERWDISHGRSPRRYDRENVMSAKEEVRLWLLRRKRDLAVIANRADTIRDREKFARQGTDMFGRHRPVVARKPLTEDEKKKLRNV